MRQSITFIILLFAAHLVLGQEIAKIENIKIYSKALHQKREILVYTPQNYEENKLVVYNVIYVFDAQNRELFDYTHSIISFLSDATKQYIVVGITSPYIKKYDYARNNDYLPILETESAKKRYGKYFGNADNFLRYVQYEVIPYIENHYRVGAQRIAIGHSLSASFILHSMVKEPHLFNAYFAISPNLAYDNERIANELLRFDYHQLDHTFLYLSNANEGVGYWEQWIPARNKVYSFFGASKNFKNIHVVIRQFPDESHWSTFAPSLAYGLKQYFKYLDTLKTKLSDETYDIQIKVKVPNKNDTVFVTGNQKSLGDWNPDQIKMNRESDYVRVIKLTVQSPVELKFTRGSWNTEGEVKYIGGFNNIQINPIKQSEFKFEIIRWAD